MHPHARENNATVETHPKKSKYFAVPGQVTDIRSFDTRTSDLGIFFQLSVLQREIKLSLQTLIMRTDDGTILMEKS